MTRHIPAGLAEKLGTYLSDARERIEALGAQVESFREIRSHYEECTRCPLHRRLYPQDRDLAVMQIRRNQTYFCSFVRDTDRRRIGWLRVPKFEKRRTQANG